MRLRVTEGMRRQLSELRGSKGAVRGGILLVPRMATPEDWQAEAEPHQRALMEWSATTHGGAEVRQSAPQAMTAPQEREYQHQYKASRHLGLTDEQRAARAYEKALDLKR